VIQEKTMYPSGKWEGFWQQDGFGRQPMRAFELEFAPDGGVRGRGVDVVGQFTFAGAFDRDTGRVLMVKQYLGKHAVQYDGRPDGEGCIQGTWLISMGPVRLTGSFLIRPAVARPTGDEPIQEL
jgi:hypothetical protein